MKLAGRGWHTQGCYERNCESLLSNSRLKRAAAASAADDDDDNVCACTLMCMCK